MSERAALPHLVIRASAGTGKTFQLTNRFLALLAAGEPPDSILATTFTRKASGEILDRVLVCLAKAALDADEAAELAPHVGDPSLDPSRCRELLGRIVRQLHRLRVGTLDSFFLQIARSFCLELGLPHGWQIVDEVVDKRRRLEAIQSLLEDESADHVTRLMHLLTKGQAARSISTQIEKLVTDLYSLYVEAPAAAWESLPRQKPLSPDELRAALAALAQAALPEGKQIAKARNDDLSRADRELWEDFLTTGLAAKVADGSELYSRKPIAGPLVELYRPLVRHARAFLLGQIANQTEATFRLLQRFDEAYQRLKIARRELRFEDVTRKLAEAWLRENVAEVGFRLDGHLAHLLLDEFQDTSSLQWRVLRPFAARVVRGDGQRSFFCVGDVKQAIYGWRGGVAEIFDTLESHLGKLEPQTLNKSWRSSQVVIDTVNRVFAGIADNRVLQKEPLAAANWAARFATHTTAKSDLTGCCRLMAAPRADEGQEQLAMTLSHAADHVAALHAQAPDYTIGVLVRRNEAVARLIFELRRRQVFASEEGGNPLTDSPAVQLVLSLLILADHPGDTAARYHVARSPLGKVVGLSDYRDQPAAWRLARQIRQSLIDCGYGPTLCGWVQQMAPACDARDLSRLAQLVELAYGYEAAATTRTDDFVTLAASRKVKDPTSAPIRVMTVHQAKGLEFDIVVLPELDARLVGQSPSLVAGRAGPDGDILRVCRYVSQKLRGILPDSFARIFDDHNRRVMEESLCVLYVALTRAARAMDLIIAPSKENERSLPSTYAGLLRAALTDASPVAPGELLYMAGDARWFERPSAKTSEKAANRLPEPPGEEGLVVRLAPGAKRRRRGLDRISPSQLEGGSLVDLEQRMRLDTSAALDRGSIVHAWMEQITWLDDGEPEDALLEAAAAPWAGGLRAAELIRQFRAMLARPAVRAVLSRADHAQCANGPFECAAQSRPGLKNPSWTVWREKPFALRDGDVIYTGRMDRVVVLYDGDRAVGADLVDFKTDALPAGDPPAIDARTEVYRPQIEVYRRAAAELLGLAPTQVSARLVYVEPGVVKAV